jgi:hypothetical protein
MEAIQNHQYPRRLIAFSFPFHASHPRVVDFDPYVDPSQSPTSQDLLGGTLLEITWNIAKLL